MSKSPAFRRCLPLAAFFLYSAASVAAPATGSPYYTDLQNTHVEDATSDGIRQVNNITCYISSMRPDALVNQGNYLALIDSNKCDESGSTSSSGNGDGSVAPNYQNAIVNSTRASNNDPMLVSVWVDNSSNGQQSTIFAHLSATQAPTDTDPYGVFRLDFCGVVGIAGPSCMMRGFMDAANGQLSFYQDGQNGGGGSQTTALQLTSVGTTSGSGGLTMTQVDGSNHTTTSTFNFAYDSAHFLRGDQCFSRDASDPATGISVWRYGLYDETSGEHIDLNSGFPIQFSSGGTTYQGFVGYFGLQLPSDAMSSITDGSTVQKVDYNSNGGAPTLTPYTLRLAGGKLTKYTRKSTNLHAIDQVVLNTFVNDATGFFNGASSNTQYELHWDDASGLFVVTGQIDCSNNGCQTHEYTTTQTVDPTFWAVLGGLQGWSQSLGGDVFIDLRGASNPLVSVNVDVVYHAQNMVYPTDIPADLYCASNCPTASSLQGFFAASPQTGPSPFDASTYNQPQGGTGLVHYTADTQGGVLVGPDSQPAVYTSSQGYQQYSQYMGGVQSGHLVTSASAIECSQGSGTYCDYNANDLPEYYTWQTGPNPYNQFAAVVDGSSQFVQFDAPLQLTYNVPNTTAFGSYAGKSIVLQYGGFGNLWGIPGVCVSSQTNAQESCDQPDARYVPQFVIPYDTSTGTVSDGTHTYLVKWLDREIRFANKDPSECSALTVPTSVTLPTAADVQNPSDPASPIYIGVLPTVTDAPRVISGVVEY